MSTPLEIQIDGTADEPVLVLRGEIDLSTIVGLRTAVDELPHDKHETLTIDLAEVTFMDSTGLGWMAGLARTGCDVRLRSTPVTIRRLLEVTGIEGVLTVLPRSVIGFAHEAVVYSGLDGFLRAVVPFVRKGVGRGEPTLVAVPGDRLGPLRDALGDTADLVTFADMEVLGVNPGRIIPAWADFLTAYPDQPVRGVGEHVWAGRSAPEVEECHRHESLLNVAFADTGAFSLLCPYDAATLDPEVVADVARTHPVVAEAGVRAPSRRCPSLEEMAVPHTQTLDDPPAPTAPHAFSERDLGALRAMVETEALSAGLSQGAAESLVLSAHELATNSVRHGGGGGVLRLWRTERSAIVEIADHGHIADPLVGRSRPTPAAAGGRGLWMAHQLCDLVQVRDTPDGTVVRLHQHLPWPAS